MLRSRFIFLSAAFLALSACTEVHVFPVPVPAPIPMMTPAPTIAPDGTVLKDHEDYA